MERLIVKDLTLEIKDRVLLNHLNFELEAHESLGIVGESGSGKTLFSRLLIGRKPQGANIQGELTYRDWDILKLKEKDWQEIRGRKIAYIAQNPHGLFNEMQTIESHGLEVLTSLLKITKDQAREKFVQAMEDFNLENSRDLLKKYPFQLSGGMLQRVMLAMMMELNPYMVIADEPTSALDSWNAENVADLLRLCKSKGTQLLVITHDYRLLKGLVDRIVILKKGDLIESGPLEEVLKNPKSEYGKDLLAPRTYKRYRDIPEKRDYGFKD